MGKRKRTQSIEEHSLKIDQPVSQSARRLRQGLNSGDEEEEEEEPCSGASVALKTSQPVDNLRRQNTKSVYYGYSSAVMKSQCTPGIPAKRHSSCNFSWCSDQSRQKLDIGSDDAFQNTREWTGPRLLEDLPDFLQRFGSVSADPGNLSSPTNVNGAPHTVLVSQSALRVIDVVRYVEYLIILSSLTWLCQRKLRKVQTNDAIVAKLFAKHIKLREAIEYVKNTR